MSNDQPGPAPDLLLQDQCRGLSIALSQAPHARMHAAQAAGAIAANHLEEEALRAASMEFLCSLPLSQFVAIKFDADTRYAIGQAVKHYLKVAALPAPKTFEDAWAGMEARGFRCGEDALEQVRLGWRMARGEV